MRTPGWPEMTARPRAAAAAGLALTLPAECILPHVPAWRQMPGWQQMGKRWLRTDQQLAPVRRSNPPTARMRSDRRLSIITYDYVGLLG